MSITQYISLGFEHIADINGYDHILFIIVMCVMYPIQEWKKIILLVTAFTVGHMITLGLSAMDFIQLPTDWIEFFIPVTIFLTAIWNIISLKRDKKDVTIWLNYFVVLFFGLIHGLGFSNYFGMLMGKGRNIIQPLFGFNIGVEIGQLIIVSIFMLITLLVVKGFKIQHKYWIGIISISAAVLSLYLIVQSDLISKSF